MLSVTQTITDLDAKEAQFLTTFAVPEQTIFTFARAREFWGDLVYTTYVLNRLEPGG